MSKTCCSRESGPNTERRSQFEWWLEEEGDEHPKRSAKTKKNQGPCATWPLSSRQPGGTRKLSPLSTASPLHRVARLCKCRTGMPIQATSRTLMALARPMTSEQAEGSERDRYQSFWRTCFPGCDDTKSPQVEPFFPRASTSVKTMLFPRPPSPLLSPLSSTMQLRSCYAASPRIPSFQPSSTPLFYSSLK